MPLNPYATTGTKIYIAPAAATEPANAAAYAALTWTEITNVASFAAFGDTVNIINAPVVGDSRVRKAAGSRDSGNMTLRLYPDDSDAGQTALIAAAVTSSTYPFRIDFPTASKVTVPGGTVAKRYFLAIVAGGQETPGGNEDIITAEYTVALTTQIVKVAAT
jgi:hypothetical protein